MIKIDSSFHLSADMKKRLLKSIQAGSLKLSHFPEFRKKQDRTTINDFSCLSIEEMELLECAELKLDSHEIDFYPVVELCSEMKKRLLKVTLSGKINLSDFPEFECSHNKPPKVDISFLTREEKAVFLKLARQND